MNGQSINVVSKLFVVGISYYFMQTLKSSHDLSLQQSLNFIVLLETHGKSPTYAR